MLVEVRVSYLKTEDNLDIYQQGQLRYLSGKLLQLIYYCSPIVVHVISCYDIWATRSARRDFVSVCEYFV